MPAKSPSEVPISLSKEQIEIRGLQWGSMQVSFERWPPGDFSPLCKGLPDDLCQVPHWGVCLKGKGYLNTREGRELLTAGMAFYAPPGHSISVIETMETIEFSPRGEESDRTAEVLMKNLSSWSAEGRGQQAH
ncbi:hypothetical protein [Archangium sp.]|uniref:hypothetical protein n=1 Tax=Archangium sp. TaxID=1872627 RepID=UPI002D5578C3|nr:hypothetical protein [Archangium sp.]HYO57612.1 hypothetical protein [Archangium sp.]